MSAPEFSRRAATRLLYGLLGWVALGRRASAQVAEDRGIGGTGVVPPVEGCSELNGSLGDGSLMLFEPPLCMMAWPPGTTWPENASDSERCSDSYFEVLTAEIDHRTMKSATSSVMRSAYVTSQRSSTCSPWSS